MEQITQRTLESWLRIIYSTVRFTNEGEVHVAVNAQEEVRSLGTVEHVRDLYNYAHAAVKSK